MNRSPTLAVFEEVPSWPDGPLVRVACPSTTGWTMAELGRAYFLLETALEVAPEVSSDPALRESITAALKAVEAADVIAEQVAK